MAATDERRGLDTVEMAAAANVMTTEGRNLAARAGDGHRDLRYLPEDPHGLIDAIRRYDQARESFQRRAGAAIERLGFTVAEQSLTTEGADGFPDLPEAAR